MRRVATVWAPGRVQRMPTPFMRQEGVAAEGLAERGEDGLALFTQGGDVATDPTEARAAGGCAEAAGDLLSDLGHADVAFGLIVVEGERGVAQEGQRGLLMGTLAVLCWPLGLSGPFQRW